MLSTLKRRSMRVAAVVSLVLVATPAAMASASGYGILRTIPIADAGPHDIVANGSTLYTANQDNGTVSVIDAPSGAVTKTINVSGSWGSSPNDLAFDGTRLWITFEGGVVVAFNPTTGAKVAEVDLSASNVDGLASDGTYLWVAAQDNVYKVDEATATLTATIAASGVFADELSIDETHVWFTDSSGFLRFIDPQTNVLDPTPITVGQTPDGVVTDGTYVWVANEDSGTISQVSIATKAVVKTITVGDTPKDIAIDGTSLWVANKGSNTVSLIDTTTGVVTETINVNSGPEDLVVVDGNVWVAESGASDVIELGNGNLAMTGTNTAPVVALGSALVALGVALMRRNRRIA